jgi:aldose 1-epimerase
MTEHLAASPSVPCVGECEVIGLGGSGLEVGVVELGARLALLRAPDRDGVLADVVLGLDPAGYAADRTFLGATVGRYANRIAGGTFVLDGCRYVLPCNEPGVALHGGTDGFDRRRFTAEPVRTAPDGTRSVTLRRTSPDGENGFPGTLDVAVTYAVRSHELSIEHTATTDRATVVNLTNHAYLNLAGPGGTVEDHRVRIPASRYLAVDERLIPTGELAPVAGTPFDLRSLTRIGHRLRDGHPQLARTRGYDHTFVLDRPGGTNLALAAYVEEPTSGRTVTFFTDQPGVQFYSGNFLDGTTVLRDGSRVRQGDAFCLEPQQFPNAPNEPGFPSTVLRPGERYRSRIVLRFERNCDA